MFNVLSYEHRQNNIDELKMRNYTDLFNTKVSRMIVLWYFLEEFTHIKYNVTQYNVIECN